MPLCQLVYVSEARPNLSERELRQLLASIREHNTRDDVTGLLILHEGSFLQIIEGEDECIDTLYDSIRADTRHSRVLLLLKGPIKERGFGDWRMGFVPVEKALVRELPGFVDVFRSESFETLRQTPDRARELLNEFREGRWRRFVEDN